MKNYERFISFEGIDFCGKSTQTAILLETLQQKGVNVHLLREPGGTIISEKVRSIILDKAHLEMHAKAEILLYSAARAQLVHQKLLPLLEQGEYIIADRFYDSTTAYQGYGRQLDVAFVQQLNHFATSGLRPAKTLFIDISPEEALRRQKAGERQKDRLENESARFFQLIYDGYQRLIKASPERFVVIPGEDSIENVAENIQETVFKIWNQE